MRPLTCLVWMVPTVLLACNPAARRGRSHEPATSTAPAAPRVCPEQDARLPAPDGFAPAFVVLHLNDIYRVGPARNGVAGGLSRVAALIQRTREEERLPVYIVHSGDFLFPSLESDRLGVERMVAALNFLHDRLQEGEPATRGELLVVPGNHEFEKKTAAPLVKALETSRFRWLGSNVKLRGDAAGVAQKVEPDALLTMGGVKVGFFALALAEGLDKAYVEKADRANYASLAHERLSALEARGAELLIGITHLEMTDDMALARTLKAEHPRLLWLAGGHDHSCMYSTSGALVTKGDSNAVRMWRLRFGRDARGAPAVQPEMLALTTEDATDEAYDTQVWKPTLAQLETLFPDFNNPIGQARVPLEAREQCVRNVETNFGNYLTDLMRAEPGAPKADIAVLNGGLLRLDDRVQGPLRGEHLERTLGFPAPVCRVRLTGDAIRRMLENSVSGGYGEGRFLQVSGLKYSFNRERPPGSRVTSVQVLGGPQGAAPLEEGRSYVVAANSFIATRDKEGRAGDGYAMLADGEQLGCGTDLKKLIQEDLQRRPRGIEPRTEGRITEEGSPPAHCPAPEAPPASSH
ncbi:bifunctional metallophosphatase/5'-nucleotidase [Pyxidicoccus fallax]|uniref:Bifunctional metallophosphatase/5'-nucleotidase n=1 Tax=Pyxidicoccus fallax TaxID=394095 RepID=A0A848LLD7_9BACT|nr:bifunctional metallophosphatase/5'-nucleotidase [Pyxidicoccus fallax]NMO18492.1 bifunctional metallophosphatase/5'-nucleotidase [Pyxidicoccus fallax]NPC81345.1 bifunctional metallophosphatase/5'-nucleotidase [Pyxidicoccus fallax]